MCNIFQVAKSFGFQDPPFEASGSYLKKRRRGGGGSGKKEKQHKKAKIHR